MSQPQDPAPTLDDVWRTVGEGAIQHDVAVGFGPLAPAGRWLGRAAVGGFVLESHIAHDIKHAKNGDAKPSCKPLRHFLATNQASNKPLAIVECAVTAINNVVTITPSTAPQNIPRWSEGVKPNGHITESHPVGELAKGFSRARLSFPSLDECCHVRTLTHLR